jgi:hypothetical protein
MKRLLGVSDTLAFKIWKLRKGLQWTAFALAAAVFLFGSWAAIAFRRSVLLQAITVGTIALFVFGLALTAIGTALVGKKLMKVIRLRETLIRAAVGLGVGIVGWLAAALHLLVFDPMFLREGSFENYRRRFARDDARPKHDGEKRDLEDLPRRRDARALNESAPPELPRERQAAAPPEVVGAGGEVVSLPTVAPPAAAGNGRAKESKPEPFPDQIDIQDPDASQN